MSIAPRNDNFLANSEMAGHQSVADRTAAGVKARILLAAIAGTEGNDVFDGTPGDDHFLGLGGDDIFHLSQGGNDLADGGTGDDSFFFQGNLTGADTLIGGAGVDRLILRGQFPDLVFAETSLVDVEAIVLQRGLGGTPAIYRITMADGNVAAGSSLILNGASLLAGEQVIFDGSAETGGVFFLYGGAGDDSLTGGTGADTMTGGQGNDSYYVDNGGDVVIEAVGGGAFDAVYSRVNYALRHNQEVELLAGHGLAPGQGISLLGNGLAQTLIGGAANDILSGGGGDDALIGNDGIDQLNGGAGIDQLNGGAGNDIYFVDNAADIIQEAAGGGADTVYTSVDYTLHPSAEIEVLAANGRSQGVPIVLIGNGFGQSLIGDSGADTLVGGGGNDFLAGAQRDDQLDGGTGADVLDGGTGADTMAGGDGDDIFFVDGEGDNVIEAVGGGAFDTVYARANYTLRPGQEVELLAASGLHPGQGIALQGNELVQTLIGTAINDILGGGGGNDFLIGNDGVDQLDGGAGNDVMVGGAGNDIYFVDNVGDLIQEFAGGGADTVYASGDFVLSSSAEVESLAANGLAPGQGILLAGNDFAQSIAGGSGNDSLLGGGGNDQIYGGAGNDLIDGGAGSDSLGGGAGADIFRFLAASDSSGAGDTVYDFLAGTDRIDLSAIDANTGIAGDQAFTFIGAAAFTNVAGQLRAVQGERAFHVYADVNGDGAADLYILVHSVPAITAGDFVL